MYMQLCSTGEEMNALRRFARTGRIMFTDCYCTQFRRSANKLTGIYDEALRPVGLKITQFSLLRALERLGAATYNEIAAEVALDKTTISRNLKVLINAGWVIVSVSPEEDARYRSAQLSKEGVKILRKAEPYWRVAQRQVEKGVQQFLNGPANKQLLDALETLQQVSSK
jgi:DNA-binding MarR family transcriptional regulator